MAGEVQFRLPPIADLPEPEAVFSADAAAAVEFQGNPELRFVQLDRFSESGVTRVVVVRYEWQVFRARAAANKEFREGVVNFLATHERKEPARLAELAVRGPSTGAATATLDADLEIMARTGGRASVFIIAMNRAHRYALALGTNPADVQIRCPLEATMPVSALAGLLETWHTLAEKGAKR